MRYRRQRQMCITDGCFIDPSGVEQVLNERIVRRTDLEDYFAPPHPIAVALLTASGAHDLNPQNLRRLKLRPPCGAFPCPSAFLTPSPRRVGLLSTREAQGRPF